MPSLSFGMTLAQCPAGCDGASAWRAPSGRLLRTAIKDRAVVLVAINEFDRIVGLYGEGDVADERPGGKPAFKMCVNVFAVALGIEESADADLGVDLLGRDFQLQPRGVAAIAFAGDVLRVASVERKIIFCRRSCAGARGKGKSDAADNWMNDFHYDSPTFCNRHPTEIAANVMQCANPGGLLRAAQQLRQLAKFAAMRRAHPWLSGR